MSQDMANKSLLPLFKFFSVPLSLSSPFETPSCVQKFLVGRPAVLTLQKLSSQEARCGHITKPQLVGYLSPIFGTRRTNRTVRECLQAFACFPVSAVQAAASVPQVGPDFLEVTSFQKFLYKFIFKSQFLPRNNILFLYISFSHPLL